MPQFFTAGVQFSLPAAGVRTLEGRPRRAGVRTKQQLPLIFLVFYHGTPKL